jgi:hypothetical protein
VSLYPLPGYGPLDDDDGDEGCANCEHIEAGHYDDDGSGCRICDDVGADCPGYE